MSLDSSDPEVGAQSTPGPVFHSGDAAFGQVGAGQSGSPTLLRTGDLVAMPSVVKVVRMLYVLFSLVLIAVGCLTIGPFTRGVTETAGSGLGIFLAGVVGFLIVAFLALYVWLIIGCGKRKPEAWYGILILTIIAVVSYSFQFLLAIPPVVTSSGSPRAVGGLLGAILGLAIAVAIIVDWRKPATKAWFRVR